MLTQKDKHLSPQEVAICADAIIENRFDELATEFKSHLQECDQCSAEVAMVTEIANPIEEVNQKPSGRLLYNQPAILILAAALVVGLIVLVVFPFVNNPQGENQLAEIQEEHTPIIEHQNRQPVDEPSPFSETEEENLNNATQPEISTDEQQDVVLLASFTPNQDLEMLVTNYQSAYRGTNISVTTESSISFPEHTSLVWDNPEGISLLVEITDNEGNDVVSASTDNESFAIPQLQPGLFYWKLIDEEDFDLIFVGKILYQP